MPEGGITLITNQVIFDEWEHNKSRSLSESIGTIKAHAKSALKLADLLPQEEAQQIQDLVAKYRDHEETQLVAAKAHFDEVDKLLRSCQVIPLTNEHKLEAVNRALVKQAPFHNSKNNVADALHFLSAVDYTRQFEIANNLLFVSPNYKEFADPNKREELHPDLVAASQGISIHFSDNLAKAFKMKQELIDELDEYHQEQFDRWIDDAYDMWADK